MNNDWKDLKTLEDFEWGESDHDFSRDDLRQLGIDWIKRLREKNKLAVSKEERQEAIWNECIIDWIFHVFNLTDADLVVEKSELVILSEEIARLNRDLAAWQETCEILADKDLMAKIKSGVEDIRNGKGIVHG